MHLGATIMLPLGLGGERAFYLIFDTAFHMLSSSVSQSRHVPRSRPCTIHPFYVICRARELGTTKDLATRRESMSSTVPKTPRNACVQEGVTWFQNFLSNLYGKSSVSKETS